MEADVNRASESIVKQSIEEDDEEKLTHNLPQFFTGSFAMPTVLVIFTVVKGFLALGCLIALSIYVAVDAGLGKPHGLTLRVCFAIIGIGLTVIELLFVLPLVLVGLSATQANLMVFPFGVAALECIMIFAAMISQEIDRVSRSKLEPRWLNVRGVYAETALDVIVFALCLTHGILCLVTYYDLVTFRKLHERTKVAIASATPAHLHRLQRMLKNNSMGVVSHF